MKPVILASFLSIAALFLFSGCGSKPSPETPTVQSKEKSESEPAEAAEETGSSFEEGKGLVLDDEIKKEIGFATQRIEDRTVSPQVNLKAHIYRSAKEAAMSTTREEKGYAYATAFVESGETSMFKPGMEFAVRGESNNLTVVLERVDRSLSDVNGSAELILRIQDPQKSLEIGEVLNISGKVGHSRKMIAAPVGAILETAEGKYVFRVNGEYCERVPVKTGLEADGYVSITDGLTVGDEIVTEPVNRLYLLERKFTNAGGD